MCCEYEDEFHANISSRLRFERILVRAGIGFIEYHLNFISDCTDVQFIIAVSLSVVKRYWL